MIERIASCACGRVKLKTTGEPIVASICHCASCQAGAKTIEALPDAKPMRDGYGGTPYLSYRDDRYAVTDGADLLRGYKLSDDAPTTRFVATCCNSAMYLKFAPGWWISTYRYRFTGDLPPPEFRSNVQSVEPGITIPNDYPIKNGFPVGLFAKLLRARVAMAVGL